MLTEFQPTKRRNKDEGTGFWRLYLAPPQISRELHRASKDLGESISRWLRCPCRTIMIYQRLGIPVVVLHCDVGQPVAAICMQKLRLMMVSPRPFQGRHAPSAFILVFLSTSSWSRKILTTRSIFSSSSVVMNTVGDLVLRSFRRTTDRHPDLLQISP
jgi:hypothetical protein